MLKLYAYYTYILTFPCILTIYMFIFYFFDNNALVYFLDQSGKSDQAVYVVGEYRLIVW